MTRYCADCGSPLYPTMPFWIHVTDCYVMNRKGGAHGIHGAQYDGVVICRACMAERELGGKQLGLFE